MQTTATSTCEMSTGSPRVSPTEAPNHYPVIQRPIHSNGDFRLPMAPPPAVSINATTAQIVSSSTCSPPSSAPGHIIMRPPPPPPPLPLKVSRSSSNHDMKPTHITHQEEPTSSIPDLGEFLKRIINVYVLIIFSDS